MLVPVGVDLRQRIQLVFSGEASMPVVGAWLRMRLDDERYAVELEGPSGLAVTGAHVGILGGPFGDTRVLGRIEGIEGGRITVRQTLAQTSEDRKSPRTTGHLDVRWRVLRATEPGQPKRWLREGFSLAPTDAWSAPEAEMDVSLDGLRFRDDAPCAKGDALLVEIGLPGEEQRHRCRGVVRRVIEGASGREVAIELADLSEDAEDVLMDVLMAGE